MSSVRAFKLVLLSLAAIIGLELLAKRFRLPPAAALLLGGAAMAFVPGLPPVSLDPELVLIVFPRNDARPRSNRWCMDQMAA